MESIGLETLQIPGKGFGAVLVAQLMLCSEVSVGLKVDQKEFVISRAVLQFLH